MAVAAVVVAAPLVVVRAVAAAAAVVVAVVAVAARFSLECNMNRSWRESTQPCHNIFSFVGRVLGSSQCPTHLKVL